MDDGMDTRHMIGGYMPLVFTSACYPDFILAADSSHPVLAKTS
jgi:hypothetical protein